VTQTGTKENRKAARVAVSKGIWVAWQLAKKQRHVSRVSDLSIGGVFIATTLTIATGTNIEMLFALPEGEMRIHGVVRRAGAGKGIGVEFTNMGSGDRARLQELLRRLNR
jgi:hypothetical protein